MTDSETPQGIWDPASRTWVTPDQITQQSDKQHRRAKSTVPALVVFLVVVTALAGGGYYVWNQLGRKTEPERANVRTPSPDSRTKSDTAKLVQQAIGSVVSVVVNKSGDQVFASGIVLDRSGYIATSAQLVQGGVVTVRPVGGAFVSTKIIGSDPLSDVAILKVDGLKAEPIIPDSAELVAPGDPLVIVGSLPATDAFVATAHVATVGRPVDGPDNIVRFNQLQLDIASALAPTGGLVVAAKGERIGMAVSTNETGAAQVVPMDIVLRVRDDFKTNSNTNHPWTGVVTGSGLTDNAKALTLVVTLVTPGSPASEAGVLQLDRITAVNGAPIRGPGTLMSTVAAAKVGDEITLSIDRGDSTIQVKLRLASQPLKF